MGHPFNLDISDLEALEIGSEVELTDEEASLVGGGRMTTMALGEEGGSRLPSFLRLQSIDPPMTTMAEGEEGGDATTMALGEEGGDMTTMALGEEGGDFSTM